MSNNMQDTNQKKIHFAVMAIGATAKKMNLQPSQVYNRLENVGLVKNLLFDCYDVLHAESLDGVVWNVEEALKNWEKPKEEQAC